MYSKWGTTVIVVTVIILILMLKPFLTGTGAGLRLGNTMGVSDERECRLLFQNTLPPLILSPPTGTEG